MRDSKQEINEDLIAALLREQHPDLAELPITLGALGWDNQMWRLGDDLAVRLPWATEGAEELLLKEHALLPAMASRLPLPVPVPRRLGRPSERFPRNWLVTSWVPGEPADRVPATRGIEAARTLAAFLTTLHQPAPRDAPVSRDGRGRPLAATNDGVANFLDEAIDRGLIPNPGEVREVWNDALAAPDWTGPAVWLHGDLHPANVLTRTATSAALSTLATCVQVTRPVTWVPRGCCCPINAIDHFHERYSSALDAARCVALEAGH